MNLLKKQILDKTAWAPYVYKKLNGIFCIYKPSGKLVHEIMFNIRFRIVKELNEMRCYSSDDYPAKPGANPESIKFAIESGQKLLEDNPSSLVSVTEQDETLPQEYNQRDLLKLNKRLYYGQRFIPEDITLGFMHGMARHSSGVLMLGIGSGGCKDLYHLGVAKHVRVYHVKGRLGWASHNFSVKGRILQRSSYYHIDQIKMDKVCAAVQASHQKLMFEYAGIDPQSQEAYNLACKGLLRPGYGVKEPLIYGIRCIDLQLPDFTLEIHCVNEKCTFLTQLVHDLGLKLKTTAVASGIRRVRHGHFQVEHALLDRRWNVENILHNIHLCKRVMPIEGVLTGDTLKPLHKLQNKYNRKRLEERFFAKIERLEKESQMLLLADEDAGRKDREESKGDNRTDLDIGEMIENMENLTDSQKKEKIENMTLWKN